MSSTPGLLIDSLIWIEFYRPDGRQEIRDGVREALMAGRVATMGIIVAEVVRGAPDAETLEALVDDFSVLPFFNCDFDVAARAARVGFALRRGGRSVPATDLTIAAVALGADLEPWHQDAHFEHIAAVTGLRQRRGLG